MKIVGGMIRERSKGKEREGKGIEREGKEKGKGGRGMVWKGNIERKGRAGEGKGEGEVKAST
jgi:hypothetical protein